MHINISLFFKCFSGMFPPKRPNFGVFFSGETLHKVKSGQATQAIQLWPEKRFNKLVQAMNDVHLVAAMNNDMEGELDGYLFLWMVQPIRLDQITPAVLAYEGVDCNIEQFIAGLCPDFPPDSTKTITFKMRFKFIMPHAQLPARVKDLPLVWTDFNNNDSQICVVCSFDGAGNYNCASCSEPVHGMTCGTRIGELDDAVTTCSLCVHIKGMTNEATVKIVVDNEIDNEAPLQVCIEVVV